MALGTVCALQQQVSRAVAQPVEEARHYVQPQGVLNLDETGWRQARATLRRQKRNVLQYLTDACEAALRQNPPPSLLPAAETVQV